MNGPRILIIKPSSLGDVVHTLPLAHALKRGLPDCHIGWVVDQAFQSLLLADPLPFSLSAALLSFLRCPAFFSPLPRFLLSATPLFSLCYPALFSPLPRSLFLSLPRFLFLSPPQGFT